MWIVVFQIGAIFSLLAVVILACAELSWGSTRGNACETLWLVKAQRTGSSRGRRGLWMLKKHNFSEVIALPEDTFLMGNRLGDDIYMNMGGGRIKLYLNVQKDRILLSVLKGKVMVHNRVFEENGNASIEIQDFTKVVAGSISLQFQRKRGM